MRRLPPSAPLLSACAWLAAVLLLACQKLAGLEPLPGLSDGGVDAPADATIDAAAPLDATAPDGAAADATIDAAAPLDATAPDGAAADARSADARVADSAVSSPEGGLDGNAPPSCARGGPGMTNCGVDASESCCASPLITGGPFLMEYGDSEDGGELFDASVSTFQLDKYLVTVGRFRQFVNAVVVGGKHLGWGPDAGSGRQTFLNGGHGLLNSGDAGGYEPGWNTADLADVSPVYSSLVTGCDTPAAATWTDDAGPNENLPINCVTWAEAYAFCIWDGAFLPSEEEWQYARVNGHWQDPWPWGGALPSPATNVTGCNYPDDASNTCVADGPTSANIAPVGSCPAGANDWGQLDLVGEENEWLLDWWQLYPTSPTCIDCANTSNASTLLRVAEGDSFYYSSYYSALWARAGEAPAYRTMNKGFRCARAP